MVKLYDNLIDLKAQVGAILAERSVALSAVTDNRERRVPNTDGASKKLSNTTPEQGGGNGGGQIPPTTIHGAGDPDSHGLLVRYLFGYLWCSFFCYMVAMRDFLCKVYDKLYCFLSYADMQLILGYESGGKRLS